MKVFLDYEREMPDGWVRVCWPQSAKEILISGDVPEISLDHNLGDDNRGSGYELFCGFKTLS